MPEIRAKVASTVGLHARPAALFAAAAAAAPVPISVCKPGGEPVDARSILSVLTLDARCGDELILAAEGPGAQEALASVVKVLETNHDQAEA
ncbi:MAG: HPr family phosphocarrier protein [Actinomycetota bacterium]|nr:HPr family phosphocarrier protein [Actinomycetota bacterium]MDA8208303.1 HPr family phosphocarrier protein [Actinomycetota bacterium]